MKSLKVCLCTFGLLIALVTCVYAQGANIGESRVLTNNLGGINAFSSSGQYSYVLCVENPNVYLIKVLDVSDNMNIRLLSSTPIASPPFDEYYYKLKLEGNTLCIIGTHLVNIFDISAPLDPVWQAQFRVDGTYRGAELYENHLLAVFGDQLWSWDLSDPAAPVLADSLSCSSPYALFVSGSLAFIRLYNGSYELVDISDPANLISLGTNQDPIEGTLVGVSGNTLITDTWFSALLYDVSDPLHPVYLTYVSDGMGFTTNVFVLGNLLYYGFYWELYHANPKFYYIIDISNPSLPQYLYYSALAPGDRVLSDDSQRLIVNKWYSYYFCDFAQDPYIGAEIINTAFSDIVATDDHAFIHQMYNSIVSYSLDAVTPAPDAELLISYTAAIGLGGDLLVTSQSHLQGDEMAFYTPNTISLYSVSNPDTISLLSSFICTGNFWPTQEIRIAGDQLVITNDSAGVAIYDVSNPLQPVLSLAINDQRTHKSNLLEANYLYSGGVVAQSSSTIVIYDLTNHSNPVVLSTIPLDFEITRLQKAGNQLYVCGRNLQFWIWNVSDPSLPLENGRLILPAIPLDFQIQNNALVVLFKNSFSIYKLSNADKATPIGACPLQNEGLSLAVSGNDVIIGTYHNATVYDCTAAFAICNPTPDEPNLSPQIQQLSTYPNPMRDYIKIKYELGSPAKTRVDIYNARGQRLRTIDNALQNAGPQIVQWDGKDAQGKSCANGVYCYKIQSGSSSAYGKLLLLK